MNIDQEKVKISPVIPIDTMRSNVPDSEELELTRHEGGDRQVNNVMHDGGEESAARKDGDAASRGGKDKASGKDSKLNKTAGSSKAKSQRAQKPKKIKKYESNSIDEEEFQDYFTNPIKRKEFDRQRKRQQMREMHNITGFTLGQFGIKSMKAMKEAMPAYPDDDDIPEINDAQKNYATVSLCCLSVTNPFRNKIIQLVAVNPWFDRFILFVIIVNCVFLAMDKEIEIVSQNSEDIDFGFLLIYTMEMIFKVIAMGFFMRAHSYLRDSWNILDFLVVVLGWMSNFIDQENISAIKVIRILRPLRTINQIPNMSSLVSTILNSLPIMFDVMILFFFMLIMFGTIATQLFGGALENRCVLAYDVDPPIPVLDIHGQMIIELGPWDEQVTIICQKHLPNIHKDCDEQLDAHQIPPGFRAICEQYENPISDVYCFDNILKSIINIFQIITLEGWTDMMYIVRESFRGITFDIFFVMSVVFGSFVILNLMIAVQASYLDQAFDAEEQQNKELKERLEYKKRQKKEQEDEDADFEEDEEEDEDADHNNEEAGSQEEGEGSGEDGKKKRRKNQQKGGCCNIKLPDKVVNASNYLEKIVTNPDGMFEKVIIVLILLNTVFLSVEHYQSPQWLEELCLYANLFFTFVFGLEMLIKLFAIGWRRYLQDGFNIFDAFIVIMSYVELGLASSGGESNSSLSVLRAFRLLRIFKIVKSWKNLKTLLSTVLESLTAITNLGVLIILFLFIAALLTKQFFSEDPLIKEDGSLSRYDFASTYQALITIFIILTGENWNEIMVEVIVQQGSQTCSIFFMFLMILGNFMLLNLFLAILLKSISDIDEKTDDDDQKEAGEEAQAPDDDQTNKNENEQQEQQQLNSSNSNIEEEFEQIKQQLMMLSNNMNALFDGAVTNTKSGANKNANPGFPDGNEPQESNASLDSQGKPKKSGGKKKDGKDQFASQQVEEDPDEEQGKSLYMFKYNNPIRKFLREVISNSYFAGFIYHMIALNSLLLALDQPELKDQYQINTIGIILLIISIIFIVECVVRIIVQGFYFGDKTYLKDPWNILDFVIVCFSILTWILEALIKTDVSFIRGFRALRALRPLRVVSKNEGIKTVVNALLESIPALMNVLLIVLLFLLVFGILGIQLFKGALGYCTDEHESIVYRDDCKGLFQVPIFNNRGALIGTMWEEKEWQVPFNNYNDILYSMLTFFEISTLEMWPDMMYNAIDSFELDHIPVEGNRQWASILFVLYIFFTTFFIMNLFISVIVEKFNQEIKKRQGADNFTEEQKEWVKIQRLLVHTKPKIIPVEPINCFRLQCFKIVQSQAFEYVVMLAIVINTFFLCIDHYDKDVEFANMLDSSNQFFVIFFTIELILKITAYGFKYYWYVNWNKFDFIIVILSLIAFDESLVEDLNFNVTALRIIRVSRLLRMVKTSEGLRTLLKTLFMSLGNILNTAALLMLILFTFSVAGMNLFGQVPFDEFIYEQTNFTNFYMAMMTLWRASTGESWNGIMHECARDQGLIAIIYWLLFQLITFFIFMNVFIAVIGESFNDNQATEDENDILALKKKDIKAFQNTWAKYNPMGELYMRTIRLPDFLRELPPPLGYQGIRIEESKLNKIIFCLNIRDHLGRVYYPEVMWTIFHSIAGMNDEKVLNCEQINNILKIVKNKYKGLGKKINLDTLCGNKYYRKELTAIKYIQAMKILTKWRAFKNEKTKNKEQQHMKSSNSDLNKESGRYSPPKATPKPKEEAPIQVAEPRNEPQRPNNIEPPIDENPEAIRQQRLQEIPKRIERDRQRQNNQYMEEDERDDGPNYDDDNVNTRDPGGRYANYQPNQPEENSYEEQQPGYNRGNNRSNANRGGRNYQEDDFDPIGRVEASNESMEQDGGVGMERNQLSNRDRGGALGREGRYRPGGGERERRNRSNQRGANEQLYDRSSRSKSPSRGRGAAYEDRNFNRR